MAKDARGISNGPHTSESQPPVKKAGIYNPLQAIKQGDEAWRRGVSEELASKRRRLSACIAYSGTGNE